jgi:formylglycine-generating enzyme required for sulfatase activity
VQVTYRDAQAYAKWLGHELPTEAEYEYAARGGRESETYPWGNTPRPGGKYMANTWQGDFPAHNDAGDGHKDTAPVGCYPANGYGLLDPVGNVWQWTRDVYQDRHPAQEAENPLIVRVAAPFDDERHPARVIKGGSFLCAPNFCVRYRPSSRQPQDPTLGTVHIGFRTVLHVTGQGAK